MATQGDSIRVTEPVFLRVATGLEAVCTQGDLGQLEAATNFP